MPVKPTERLEYLFKRYFDGACTPKEEDELLDFINEAKYDEQLKELMDQVWTQLSSAYTISNEQSERILSGILTPFVPEKNIIRNRRKALMIRWSAVAAVLAVLIATGGIWYKNHSGIKQSPVMIAGLKEDNNDVAPGGNKAVLTLANGTKIILDTANNGQLAVQGNSKIIKIDSGLLAYNANATNHNSLPSVTQYNTLTTPRGGQYRVILPDGSEVWLNAASSVTFPTTFTGNERRIKIKGEGYFEIAKDNQHPFIVSVDKAEIAVLGTHFNVMDYADEDRVKTTLLQGSIKVSWKDQHVIVKPGQQASFSMSSHSIRVERVDTSQAVAWTEGKLSLNDLGVEAIMRRISRWYNVDVTFDGPVPQGHFSGLINRDITLLDMLRILRANGINANFRDNTIIVSDH